MLLLIIAYLVNGLTLVFECFKIHICRKRSSLGGQERKGVIYVNSDEFIASIKITSLNTVETIIWRTSDYHTLLHVICRHLYKQFWEHLNFYNWFWVVIFSISCRGALTRARAIASVLYEVLNTVTNAAGSQVPLLSVPYLFPSLFFQCLVAMISYFYLKLSTQPPLS